MLDIAICAGSAYNDGGALTCQVALHGAGSTCTPGLAYSPFGFKGRPGDPVVDAQGNIQDGALVLYWYEGSTLHTMPLDDGRRSTKLPALDKGGSIQYADADGAYGLFSGDGTYQLRVPAGKSVTVQVGTGAQIKVTDSTVQIGDANARALAHSQEVLVALNAISTAFAAMATAMTNNPAVYSAFATAMSTPLTTVTAAISAIAATLPTTQALGT